MSEILMDNNSLIGLHTPYTLPTLDPNHCNRETGYKEYEVNNHLGNVQATVT